MLELRVAAEIEQLETILQILDELFDSNRCDVKTKMQLSIAVEEIFANIVEYAYGEAGGDVEILSDCYVSHGDPYIMVQFKDGGEAYNPLEQKEPDIGLSADQREIGGLGIFMVKKTMDEMRYSYEDGRNVLTIHKKI